MRILFVTPYYKPFLGGIERIIDRLSTELRGDPAVEAIGVLTTRVYFPTHVMRELPGREIRDGVHIFRCTFRPAALPHVFHVHLAGYASPEVPAILRRFRPDVIHFAHSEWWAANLGIYLLSRRRAHVLSTFYHEIPRGHRTLPLFTANRWLLARMDAIHTLTATERAQIRAAYGAPARRTVVIPPGVDLPECVPDRVGRAAVTVLAVGRLSEHKGQLRLLHMVAALRRQDSDRPIRVRLAGAEAGAGPALAAFVRAHGLEGAVDIVGHCSDAQLQALYREADIFALPTRYESFGLVFIEALAQGLPVVTYGVGPVPSILTAGALVVPPGDEAAFGAALGDLVRDADRRRRLGVEGRALVQARYSWGATGRQFLALYRRVAARRRA